MAQLLVASASVFASCHLYTCVFSLIIVREKMLPTFRVGACMSGAGPAATAAGVAADVDHRRAVACVRCVVLAAVLPIRPRADDVDDDDDEDDADEDDANDDDEDVAAVDRAAPAAVGLRREPEVVVAEFRWKLDEIDDDCVRVPSADM